MYNYKILSVIKPYSIPIAPLTTRVYAFAKMTKFQKRYVSHSPIFTNPALTPKETSSGAANELTKCDCEQLSVIALKLRPARRVAQARETVHPRAPVGQELKMLKSTSFPPHVFVHTAHPFYNDSGYNDTFFIAVRFHGID